MRGARRSLLPPSPPKSLTIKDEKSIRKFFEKSGGGGGGGQEREVEYHVCMNWLSMQSISGRRRRRQALLLGLRLLDLNSLEQANPIEIHHEQ